MINVLICDDEQHFRRSLRTVINKVLQLKGLTYTIYEYESGEALIAEKKYIQADIIFLDIEMKQLDGVATARLIRRLNKNTIIIFITAFPDFVFHGYEVRALNYLLKPYDDKKISDLLTIALEELDQQAPYYYLVEQKAGSFRLLLDDTWYFTSERRQITAVSKENSHAFYHKLDDLERELPDFFIRIHNRYLVNLNHLSRLEGQQVICGADSLPVSRRYKQEVSIAFANKLLGR